MLYLELVKNIVAESVKEIKENYVMKGEKMDLIAEVQKITIRVLLNCAFGSDISKISLEYEENGNKSLQPVHKILGETFNRCMKRKFDMQIILFPDSYRFHYKADDLENLRNIQRLRDFMSNIVDQRRVEMKQPDFHDKGDLLSTLLQIEFFDNKLILDECFTFFFAGSQTMASGISNEIFFLVQKPELREKIIDEFQRVVVQPYESANPGKKYNIVDGLDFAGINELAFNSLCFMESLRIEAPVQFSTYCMMSEDTEIGKYTFKKGTSFLINMHNLHHDEDEWIEPEKYLPERFEPSSKYYLTPHGTKRHPMSYGPFLGGKRICLGKTFADMVSRVVAPNIMHYFDFEFEDKKHLTEKPVNNVTMFYLHKVMVSAKMREETM